MESSILNPLFQVASIYLHTAFMGSVNSSDNMGLCCCIILFLKFLFFCSGDINGTLLVNEQRKGSRFSLYFTVNSVHCNGPTGGLLKSANLYISER